MAVEAGSFSKTFLGPSWLDIVGNSEAGWASEKSILVWNSEMILPLEFRD